MLTVLGLSFIVSLAGRNLIKGFLMAALGFLLAMVGLDPQSSIQRFTFGQLYLWEGISVVPVVVGLFGGEVTVPTPFLPLRAMTLRGSYVGSHADMAELLDLVNRSGMPEVPIRTRSLDEVSAALGDLRAGKVVGRVVLTPAA